MKTMTLLSGIGIGLVAGTALTAVMLPVNAKMLKKSMPVKAARCVGKMVEHIT